NSTPNITDAAEIDSERKSTYRRVHRESTSLPCSLSSRSNSICEDEEDEDISSYCSNNDQKEVCFEYDSDASPLFLDIQCSVKCEGLEGHCTLESMPTCLGDVIPCLGDNQQNVDISHLNVSLSVICLTLNLNSESVFSVQPSTVPNEDASLLQTPETVLKSLPSFIQNEPEKDFMSHLPDFQKNVINNFMTKIQWMLQDEIVASYLKSYPISESILESVANHVQNSDLSTFCIREEIPLKFVQSQESSLEKFEAIFCRQELSGFQLKKEGKFYYLVYAEHKTKNSRGVRSSLIPPLNFLTQIESFHCVDSTELKQVCSENENANSCRKFSESRNASGDTYGLPATTLSIKRNVRSNSRLENEIDDSDNSDNSDVVAITSKKRLRKISKTREKSQSESRSASVPPSSPIEKNQEQRKPGQSAPAEMFDFLASIKSPKKVASPELTEEKPVENNEDIIDEELIDYSNPNPTVQSYAKRKLKDIIESSSSTTNFGSNAKEEFSEPEDAGYDPGDSSDSDGELNWQVRDNKQPILPSFWIILRINIDSVVIYFHTRHILDKSEGLDEAMNIWSELKQVICKNCRIVNQTVLLNHLHEYRMCNDLLVRNDELRVVKHERAYSFGLSAEFDNSISLDATKLYEPGSFECDEVWQIHFPLHPRLYSSNPRPSRGIQAVRSVLNSFSVNNRQNMFVYQDNSGNVFYLRLSEISCAGHGIDQELVQDVSKFSSSESLADNKSLNNFSGAVIEDFMSFRERVNSTASENYNTHETLSVASQNSSAMERLTLKGSDNQDCIVLHVYGIGEVGEDIKELMYDSLQKKLDEAVLDVLIVALTRNPHCKLTPKDVFFIQRPKKPPNLTTKYFITPKLLGFLHPIKIYLRQNLLNFLNNPKYTDTDSQNHFKAFSKMSSDVVVEDDDVFLLYRQQASGTSGSKGIACIILSIVDGNDNFVRSISSPPVRVNTHCDLPLVSDFEEEVECKVYNEEEENVKSPGPIAILRFQIWSTGKVDLEQLSNKLKDAVKCAFWDVVTEYRFLMVPLCDWNDMEESGSFSAPISPRKERRLGRILREDEKIKLLHQLEEIQTKESKEFFSSVPDMRGVKSNNLLPPLPLKQDSSMLFQLNNELNCPIVEDCKKEVKSHENISTTKIFGDYLNLVKIYRSSLRKWMDFGTKFGVPSVSIKEYKLMSRRSVVHFVKELFGYITTLSPTVCVKTYQCINEENETFKEILDLNDCCSNEVGVATEYIMILRNIELWKAFIGFHEQRKVYLESLFSSKSKSNQRMPPHICNFKSSSSEILGNPLSAVSHNSLTSYSQLDVKSCISIEEQNETPFVPRQKIFMILVEDKDVKLYIYNWSIDAIQSITNFAENLTEWQNSRTSVLYSFVAQKMGLFHNQPFQRKCPSVKHSNVQIQRRDTFSSFPSLDKLKAQKTHSCPTSEYTDLLIEHNSPTVAAVVNKKTTTAVETKKRRAGDISSFFRECLVHRENI
ncbi:protein SZT2-like protein, partial [Leptotrombidium deliense]